MGKNIRIMLKHRARVFAMIIATVATHWNCANKTTSQNAHNSNEQISASRATTPERQKTQDKITEIVARELGIDPGAVDPNLPLSQLKVAADELDVVEIVMSIEEELDVEIKDEEIEDKVGGIAESLSVKKLTEIVANRKKF